MKPSQQVEMPEPQKQCRKVEQQQGSVDQSLHHKYQYAANRYEYQE